MTYKGVVHQGGIVFPPGVQLPEGAEVRVEVVVAERPKDAPATGLSTRERLLELARKAEGLVAPDRTDSEAEGPSSEQCDEEPEDGYALNRELLKFAGIVKDLPPDFSINHDHYLYGVPKRE